MAYLLPVLYKALWALVLPVAQAFLKQLIPSVPRQSPVLMKDPEPGFPFPLKFFCLLAHGWSHTGLPVHLPEPVPHPLDYHNQKASGSVL